MKGDTAFMGRTGPAVPQSCGCDVLPWEPCEHFPFGFDAVQRGGTPAPLTPAPIRESQALRVARAFHEAYERLAPLNGYETRKDTRHFDPNTANGRTMLAVCAELLRTDVIRARQGGNIS
jgi:hypothetical protein